MNHKNTQDREERAEGASVAVFSIFITFTALLLCVVVTLLTVQSAKPATPGTSSEDGAATSEQQPSGSSVPVFSPSVTVLPYTTTQTAQISDITSAYAVLVDAETGEILAAKEADTRFDMASITKIMTLLVACQHLTESDLDQRVDYNTTVRDYVTSGGYQGASVHWSEDKYLGDRFTVRDLLYGIGVESAADCTVMTICYLVGKSPEESEATFVNWMNMEAAAMGLEHTSFDNVIGYESEQNYSTASDLAAVLIRALDCPLIREILSCPSYEFYAYYDKDGTEMSYRNHFYSTLFNARNTTDGRMGAYYSVYGKDFALSSADFKGGKTGSLKFDGVWNYSLASFAVSKSTGKTYVLITGNATGSTSKQGSANVMKDAKTIYDSYIK